jgi:hypothetical protein
VDEGGCCNQQISITDVTENAMMAEQAEVFGDSDPGQPVDVTQGLVGEIQLP